LAQLPLVNGKPDFSTLGDPVDVAKQWAAEIKPGYEQYLQKLLKGTSNNDDFVVGDLAAVA
jgi:hypothetical protein